MIGLTLMEMGRVEEALPYLERVLGGATRTSERLRLTLHYSRAWLLREEKELEGEWWWRGGREEEEETEPKSQELFSGVIEEIWEMGEEVGLREQVGVWEALGEWGTAAWRSDRMQEGYERALECWEALGEWGEWERVAGTYLEIAREMRNEELVVLLEREVAKRGAGGRVEVVVRDREEELLAAGEWERAYEGLRERAREGEAKGRHLLAGMVETAEVPLALRLQIAEELGEVGDPRLLDYRRGNSELRNYWCEIGAGKFWYGEERVGEELREKEVKYGYRIGRYAVTNGEYRRFMEEGVMHGRSYGHRRGGHGSGV